MLKRLPTRIDGLMLFESRSFADERGYFTEVHHAARYSELGLDAVFVQDNLSSSHEGVVRGMHLQHPNPQAKLIRALQGRIFDVAVDLRVGSSTFGQWEAFELSDQNGRSVFVPEGFAHGFQVLDGPALVLYKCTGFWSAPCEHTLRWDDPSVGIQWPPTYNRILSPKDEAGLLLDELMKRWES